MNETERAYLAGVMDACGHISINRSRNKACTRGFALSVRVHMMINELDFGDFLKDLNFYWIWRSRSLDSSKVSYAIMRTLEDTLFFLKQIQPYLVKLARNADLMIEFIESRLAGLNNDGVYSSYLDSEVGLAEKLQALNRKRRKRRIEFDI